MNEISCLYREYLLNKIEVLSMVVNYFQIHQLKHPTSKKFGEPLFSNNDCCSNLVFFSNHQNTSNKVSDHMFLPLESITPEIEVP